MWPDDHGPGNHCKLSGLLPFFHSHLANCFFRAVPASLPFLYLHFQGTTSALCHQSSILAMQTTARGMQASGLLGLVKWYFGGTSAQPIIHVSTCTLALGHDVMGLRT